MRGNIPSNPQDPHLAALQAMGEYNSSRGMRVCLMEPQEKAYDLSRALKSPALRKKG